MYIKIHQSYRIVVALCDDDILGKTFKEGKRVLFLRETFYNGEHVEHDQAVEMLQTQAQEDATFNIAGEESVKAALEAGIITKEGIGHIEKIPYALVLL